MKLDPTVLRYLEKDHFRVLTAVEMGMKNHAVVPAELVASIAGLRHGGVGKILQLLLRHKLVSHTRKHFDGYALTYLGYDFLALRVLRARGIVSGVGQRIGVGKESDIHVAQTPEGETIALKFHRLGRISFRAVREKRNYSKTNTRTSWLYLSRLAALKEHAFQRALHRSGFPVPVPLDQNRHVVAMSLVHGVPLNQVRQMRDPQPVFRTMLHIAEQLAAAGLVHCDLNEFNVMIGENNAVTLIDFPQMVSTSHPQARMFFERDVQCVVRFFANKLGYGFDARAEPLPEFPAEEDTVARIDEAVVAAGFTEHHQQELDKLMREYSADGEGEGAEGTSGRASSSVGGDESSSAAASGEGSSAAVEAWLASQDFGGLPTPPSAEEEQGDEQGEVKDSDGDSDGEEEEPPQLVAAAEAEAELRAELGELETSFQGGWEGEREAGGEAGVSDDEGEGEQVDGEQADGEQADGEDGEADGQQPRRRVRRARRTLDMDDAAVRKQVRRTLAKREKRKQTRNAIKKRGKGRVRNETRATAIDF